MKNRHWILLFVLLILACAALFCFLPGKAGPDTVLIYQDGQLLHTIDLSRVKESYTIELERSGSTNTVMVSPDAIAVTKATCDTQICVGHGPLSHGGMPIICLPNRVVIQWAEDPTVDAVA